MRYYREAAGAVDLYTLDSVPIFRKYDAYIDIFFGSSDKVNYFLPSPYKAVTAMMIHHT